MADNQDSLTPEEQKKSIIIEYVGGFKDGLVLRMDSEDQHESDQAFFTYLAHSRRGKIGTKFRTYSNASVEELMGNKILHTPSGPKHEKPMTMPMNHIYQVTDRQEDDKTIRVIYRYMGQED